MNRPLLPLLLLSAFASPALGGGISLMVPAYFGPQPGGDWDRLAIAAKRVPLVAILNPASGPGASASAQYTRAIQAVRAAGGRVTGYVSTAYGQRPTADAKADILRYHQWYTLDGFFLDEMSNDGGTASVAYYQELHDYIVRLKATYHVTANPGTQTAEIYVSKPTVDTVVTFENGSGYPGYVASSWNKKYPAHRFCHLLHSVASTAALTNAVQLAQARNAGFLYVTDDVLDNPWDTLPTYWETELNLVEAANRAAAQSQPPRVELKRTGADTGRLEVSGPAGRYLVSRSQNLPVWSPLATNLTFTGQVAFDTVLLTAAANTFFQARID